MRRPRPSGGGSRQLAVCSLDAVWPICPSSQLFAVFVLAALRPKHDRMARLTLVLQTARHAVSLSSAAAGKRGSERGDILESRERLFPGVFVLCFLLLALSFVFGFSMFLHCVNTCASLRCCAGAVLLLCSAVTPAPQHEAVVQHLGRVECAVARRTLGLPLLPPSAVLLRLLSFLGWVWHPFVVP